MADGPETFFIRSARQVDLEAIRSLLVETWHDTYDPLIGAEKVTEITDHWHAITALAARLERPRSEYIVADSGDRIGGVAFAEANETGESVFLRQLYVLPELQGQGIGSAMLDEITVCFPEAKRMCLEVEDRNLRAIGFYSRQGFRETNRTKDDLGLEVVNLERSVGG